MTGFVWGRKVECEKRRGDEANSKGFDLSNREDKVVIYFDGETLGETRWGSGGSVFGFGFVTSELPRTHLSGYVE